MLLRPVRVEDLRLSVGDGIVSLSGPEGPVLDVTGDLSVIAERLERMVGDIYDAHAADRRSSLRRHGRRPLRPPTPRLVSAGALSAGWRVLPDTPPSGRITQVYESSWVTVLSVVKCGRAVEVATDAPSRSVRLWDADLSLWALPAVEDEINNNQQGRVA